MRKLLLAAVIAAAALPAAPALAYCDPVTSAVLGHCANPCTVAGSAYNTANHRTGDRLPDDVFICYA